MMRKLGGWLLLVVGVILAIGGAAGAIFVGPDNAVQSGVRHIESPGAAIVTGPGAIDYAGPTLRIEARSSSGPVFVGVGSEVDVQDLMSDVTHSQIDDIKLPDGDLQTSLVQGSQDFLAVGPDLDWWLESSEADIAVVVFALPEKPVSVVVMNADGSSPVDVEVAAELSIRGLFWGLLAVAVVGLGLLNLGVLMLVRARKRAKPQVDEPVASEGAA